VTVSEKSPNEKNQEKKEKKAVCVEKKKALQRGTRRQVLSRSGRKKEEEEKGAPIDRERSPDQEWRKRKKGIPRGDSEQGEKG